MTLEMLRRVKEMNTSNILVQLVYSIVILVVLDDMALWDFLLK